MFDYEKISDEVESYRQGWWRWYDIPAIVEDLSNYVTEDGCHITTIEEVDPDDFFTIVYSHAK